MHHQSTKYLNFTLYSLFLMIMTYIIVSIRSQQCSYCPQCQYANLENKIDL